MSATEGGWSTAARVRLAILLLVLVGVILYAVRDVRSRRARTDWDHTLQVAVVLLAANDVDPEAIQNVRARSLVLAERLKSEIRRHRSAVDTPFRFDVLGAYPLGAPPPNLGGSGVTDLLDYARAKTAWVNETDARIGLSASDYDTRIYVTARRPKDEERSFVEGHSEVNGRIGMVDVELDPSMADLALFVVAHELMHTLGATDKYDESGHAVIPDGLAEPDRAPRYPQRFAEVMARNRVIGANQEAVPKSLDELAIGPTTAREIRWLDR